MKAADIDAPMLLGRIAALGLIRGAPRWVQRWDLEPLYPDVPPKVLLAKLRRLYRAKLLDGCPCGCRGDWVPTTSGMATLDLATYPNRPA